MTQMSADDLKKLLDAERERSARLEKKLDDAEERHERKVATMQGGHEEAIATLKRESDLRDESLRAIAERAWLRDARRTENDLIAAGLGDWVPEIRTDYEAGRLGKKASAA